MPGERVAEWLMRGEGAVGLTHLTGMYSFASDKFLPQLVHGSDGARAFLLCLEPGQGLGPRSDSEEMLCYVVEGRARLTLGEDVLSASAGDLGSAAPGEVRGIEAEERCVVLWVHLAEELTRRA
jgi:quercetin dioxygenase-like cupin family protein